MLANVMKFSLLLVGMVLIGSCGNKAESAAAQVDSVDTVMVEDSVVDSTFYGRACDCGMSSFNLALDNGDTIYTDRMSSTGQDGIIYGDLELDDRFCMIAAENNSVLVSAINLTQLELFVKDYRIVNGQLYLNNEKEPVTIVDLSARSLVIKDAQGERTLEKQKP